MSVLERVDVRDFLNALGVEVDSQSGDNVLFCCPFHNDRHPSARMNIKTTAWLCSVGCGKGNAIHFLSMLRQMTHEDARDHIYGRYGIGPAAPIDDLESEVLRNLARRVEIEDARVLPDKSWIDYLAIDWEVEQEHLRTGQDVHPAYEYMLHRGFGHHTLKRWQIGYDPLSRRVTIPVHDVEGQLVGFKGRAIDDVYPRYLIIGDTTDDLSRYGFHTYRKSEHVFGLDRCVANRHWSGVCVVVEGELNAIAMTERHQRFAVAVAGSEFSDRQRELIAHHCRKVVIYFDDDGWKCSAERHYIGEQPGDCPICGAPTVNPGRRGTVKVANALVPFIDVEVILGAPDDAAALRSDQVVPLLRSARSAMELAVLGELDLVLTV